MRLIDLSHPITAGMSTAPGLPGPTAREHLSFDDSRELYAAGTEFFIGHVGMVTSTGTYLDAPRHRFRDGTDVANVSLDRCAHLPAVVVDAREVTAITADHVPDDVHGAAVLFHTGWDRHWGSDLYGSDLHPHLTASAAAALVEGGAALVGVDTVNVDDTAEGVRSRPMHTALLGADVLIVENLTNLAAVPSTGARFSAAPLAFVSMPAFPVRAFALAQEAAGLS